MTLAKKILIIPALFTLALGLSGGVALFGLSQVTTVMERLHTQSDAQMLAVTEIARDMQTVRSALFSLLSQYNAGSSDEEIQNTLTTLSDTTTQVQESLAGFSSDFDLSEADKTEIQAIQAAFDAYGASLTETADMAAIDTTTAVIFQDAADTEFEKTYGQLNALVGRWQAQSDTTFQHALSKSETIFQVQIITFVSAFIIAFGCALYIARTISRSLSAMTLTMQDLAQGNLEADIIGENRRDEIGSMAASVRVFKDGLLRSQSLSEIAEKEQYEKEQRAQKMINLQACFTSEISTLTTTVERAMAQMQTSTMLMANTVRETSEKLTIASSSVEQASSKVNTVAAATEEMSVSSKEIATMMVDSAQSGQNAISQSSDVMQVMGTLSQAVTNIGDVAVLINNIATQTNLLALNATVESARAGEAGKGFAVVANEVKNLAAQTANATDQITQQIDEVSTETGHALQAIQGVNQVIETIGSNAHMISERITEQNTVVLDISENIQNAADDTDTVSDTITVVNEVAASADTEAHHVAESLKSLKADFEKMSHEINRFVTEITAISKGQ